MKILSFSLYGDNPLYTIGCVKNAQLHKKFFTEWEMRVYHNNTVPENILNELKSLDVNLINTNQDRNLMNSLWRFLPICENVEYFISRDCDSRISERDMVAVEEWVNSGKKFHIIRDHPIGHGWPMNAGMWGAKGNSFPNFYSEMEQYLMSNDRKNDKSIDQCFLRDIIYPFAKNDVFVHDEYFNYEGIGTNIKRDRKLDDFAFIGESIDENDQSRYTNHPGDQRQSVIQRYLG
jgi:protein O-GlcNAc transferase